MTKNDYWITKARIVCLDKVYPYGTLVTGIPREKQIYYDNDRRCSGGNGTYRILTGKFWEMTYCVYRPGPGRHEPVTYCLDVHEYFSQTLRLRLGWNRISPKRLDRIKELIVGKKIAVRSVSYCRYGSLAEDFLPLDYDSWDSLFDHLLADLS